MVIIMKIIMLIIKKVFYAVDPIVKDYRDVL